MTPHILVVDDEVVIRSLLDRLLRKSGWDVTLASSGAECLGALQKKIPDVLILDFNLPDLKGDVLCRRIRENPETQRIPILILTGSVQLNLTIECLEEGADDYMSKPFDTKEMIARLRGLLRRRR